MIPPFLDVPMAEAQIRVAPGMVLTDSAKEKVNSDGKISPNFLNQNSEAVVSMDTSASSTIRIENLSEPGSSINLPASITAVKKLARSKKNIKMQSNTKKSVEEKRWKAKKKEEIISEEARQAWEVGKKLGLISKVSDERMINQIKLIEREDRVKAKTSKKSTGSGDNTVY